MKTAKYYRLHNNYGGQKGGGGRWKATKAKLKNWGSNASSFVGKTFQTQSYQAKQKAIDAMGKNTVGKNTIGQLKERDYRFMLEILKNSTAPKSNRSRQRESEKLINIIAKMSPVDPNKSPEDLKKELSDKSREALIKELHELKNTKSEAYARQFSANHTTTDINAAKQSFTTKQNAYQGLLDKKELAIRALRDAKTRGKKKHNPEYYKLLKGALTDAEKQVKEFNKNELKTLQAKFLKNQATYNKLVGEEGTIGALENTAKEKTVAKRVYKAAINTAVTAASLPLDVLRGVKKAIINTPLAVAKAVWSPMKTYRALTETENPQDYVNKLSTGKKEYENKLKEHMNDPVKRAKVEQYISALTAINSTLGNYDVKNKKWSTIATNLETDTTFTNLSRDNQTIVKNGLRAKFMKYRYENMKANTVSKALTRKNTMWSKPNNNTLPHIAPIKLSHYSNVYNP